MNPLINFKIAGIDSRFLTIEKPSGKVISFILGDIVKAKIMDILPSGGVTLKIKGELITAKTEISLHKGESAFFKITDLPTENNDLKLQFMGYADKSSKKQEIAAFNLKDSAIPKLILELTNLIPTNQQLKNLSDINLFKLQALHLEILKALPPDVNLLPKDVRMKLQGLLQASLNLTGQGIHTRLGEFISQLPEGLKKHPVVEGIKRDLMVSIEKMLQTPMKNILQDTGIVLEPKLRAIARLFLAIEQFDNLKSSGEKQQSGAMSLDKETMKAHQTLLQHNISSLKKDLKAGLLQLRQLLIEGAQIEKPEIAGQKTLAAELVKPNSELLNKVGMLIKDIETFQLLSKTTDSFYTFLPLLWKDLRDGGVSFRRGKRDTKGVSYSCRINLDLERLGKLSALVTMHNREFMIFFKTNSPEFQAILVSNTNELYKSFSASGLRLNAVNFLNINEPIEQIEELQADGSISIRA